MFIPFVVFGDDQSGLWLLRCAESQSRDHDNDNDTLRKGQPTSVKRPGLTGMSEGVITPRKKESVEAVVPCALGKVCNWDTVEGQCAVT